MTHRNDPLSGLQKLLEPELWIRKIWHIGACFLVTICYVILPFAVFFPWFSALTLLWIVFEFIRLTPWAQNLPIHELMRSYILKSKEHETFTAALQTVLAILVVVWITNRTVCTLALLYLTFGDPLANIVGVAFNGPKFYRNKSLHGTFAVCIFCLLLTFVYLLIKGISPLVALYLGLIGGLAAGLFEAVNWGLDDNASLILGSALSLQIAFYFLVT